MAKAPPVKKPSVKEKTKGDPLEAGLIAVSNKIERLCKDTKETFAAMLKTFCAHEDLLNNMLKKMDSMDEMMGLVLVAIRQNEYLQAYYPEQHGFPAGKYVGTHPAKLMEGKRQ